MRLKLTRSSCRARTHSRRRRRSLRATSPRASSTGSSQQSRTSTSKRWGALQWVILIVSGSSDNGVETTLTGIIHGVFVCLSILISGRKWKR